MLSLLPRRISRRKEDRFFVLSLERSDQVAMDSEEIEL